MIETVYPLYAGDEKAIERVLFGADIHYLHFVFPKGEGLPVHNANANLYMTPVRGTLSITLGDQPVHEYKAPAMVMIPEGTKMHVQNLSEAVLEIVLVKAPAPKA